MQVTQQIWGEAILALRKTIAMYELLHSHADGQTDLTEDQLANVVTGVADEARLVLEKMKSESDRGPQA
jgi:hypothetical protein